jgi:hypothetical protein
VSGSLEREHRRCDVTDGRIGYRRRGPVEHEQPSAGDLACECLTVADRKDGSRRPCTTSAGIVRSARRSRQRGVQSSLENTRPTWSDGPRPCEAERRERVRMIKRGDLGDHPVDADARQVRLSVIELTGERRGVRGKISERVCGSLGIDGGRRARVTQVVSHDVAPAPRERHTERVGPGEHGRGAHEQNQRRRRGAEVLDPERDAVRLDRCHHARAVALSTPATAKTTTSSVQFTVKSSTRSFPVVMSAETRRHKETHRADVMHLS